MAAVRALRGQSVGPEALAGTDPARAEQIAHTITNPAWRAQALAGLAQAVAGTDPDRADHLATNVQQLTRTATDALRQDAALAGVAATGFYVVQAVRPTPGTVAVERNFFGIGVDSDQAKLFPDAPVLTSMLKRVDNAVFQTVEAFANDSFPGGEVQTFGLEEDGISLAEFGEFDDLVPQEVKDAVDQARSDIIDGTVEVPESPQG